MTTVPIRTRLVVLRDGSTLASSIAFCAPDGRSVPVSRCRTCGFGKRFARDDHGRLASLECGRVAPGRWSVDEPADRAEGDVARTSATELCSIPVGSALAGTFVCFTADAPVGAVVRFFDSEPVAFGFPVVDEGGRLVGTLARATATLALVGSSRGKRFAGELVVPPRVVSERASIAATLASMRACGAQEMTVLAADRTLAGMLRDIDALRFLGRALGTDPNIQLAG